MSDGVFILLTGLLGIGAGPVRERYFSVALSVLIIHNWPGWFNDCDARSVQGGGSTFWI